jgi:hypothetical protein
MDMMKLANLVFFLGCALAVAHYYGWGSMAELLGVVTIAFCLMRVLSSRRRLN